MKLLLKIQNVKTGNSWDETYEPIGIGDNGNTAQAEDWASQLIKQFNETCRPGESRRKLLGTTIVGESTAHDWYKRTDGMSVNFRGRLMDIFECRLCGITGKRAALRGSIKRDSKFKAKKYETCGKVRHGED